MLIEYTIEVPNTNIKEPVSALDDDLRYNMAQQFGHAQLVCYAQRKQSGARRVHRSGLTPIRSWDTKRGPPPPPV